MALPGSIRSSCFLLLAAFLAGVLPAGAAPTGDRAIAFHAKRWEGTITVANSQTFSRVNEGGYRETIVTRRQAIYRVALTGRTGIAVPRGAEVAAGAWAADAKATTCNVSVADRYTGTNPEGKVDMVKTIAAAWSGPLRPMRFITLGLDATANTCTLFCSGISIDCTEEVQDKVAGETTTSTYRNGVSLPDARAEKRPWPAAGIILAGNTTFEEEYDQPDWREIAPRLKYTVSWRLYPAGVPPELRVDPGSFRDYMPSPADAGRVRIYSPRPDSEPAKIRVYLSGISREPGACLNSADAGADPDLAFDDAANAPAFVAPVQAGGEWMIESRQEEREVRVAIACSDYGAFATLRAEACIAGTWKPVAVGATARTATSFPLDENGNHVADAWEDKEGVRGDNRPAEWDGEDTPTLNGKAGDGLTLYEEYRGLLVRGAHRRLSAATKDLVVENQAPAAAGGIALFAAATKLNVVAVQPGELLPDPGNAADTTVVNARHGAGHAGLQHGLRLTGGAAGGDGVGGETVPRQPNAKRTASPREVEVIRFPATLEADLRDPARGPAVVDKDVAHELGHALGARHHGEATAYLIERTLNAQMVPPQYTVYGEDGVPVTTRPLTLKGMIGAPGNEISGDVHCIMAYAGIFTWALHKVDNTFTLYAVGQTTPGAIFCTSPAGTGINAKDHQPAPLFGDAAAGRGDCLGALQVRDY